MMADAAVAAAVVVAVVARTTGGHGTQNACILNEIYAMYCVKCASMFSRYFSGNLASGSFFVVVGGACVWAPWRNCVHSLVRSHATFLIIRKSLITNMSRARLRQRQPQPQRKRSLDERIPLLTIIERRSRSILIMRLR